jgi:hypothetical protein
MRADLAELSERMHAELFVIQVTCRGEKAAERLIRRARFPGLHAGANLTTEKVINSAENYEPFEQALTIDTTGDPMTSRVMKMITSYISGPVTVAPFAWASHRPYPLRASQRGSEQSTFKLSEVALSRAANRVVLFKLGFAFIIYCVITAIIPLGIKMCSLSPRTWSDILEWGTFWLATAGISGIFVAYFHAMRTEYAQAVDLIEAGNTPRFEIPPEGWEQASDREIFAAYSCRLV